MSSNFFVRKCVFDFVDGKKIPHNFNPNTRMAGKDWFPLFRKRNLDLSIRKAQRLNPAQAQKLNRNVVNDYFAKLKFELDKHGLKHDGVSKCLFQNNDLKSTSGIIVTQSQSSSGTEKKYQLKRLLAATESYTLFIKENLAESVTKEIFRLYNKLSTEEQSSLSRSTATTGTCSTTVHTQARNVDVLESKPSHAVSGSESSAGLFGPSTSTPLTPQMSSTISAVAEGKLITYKSGNTPADADLVLKLEIYPMEKVPNLEPSQWWKHALLRTKCAYSSGAPTNARVVELRKEVERRHDVFL